MSKTEKPYLLFLGGIHSNYNSAPLCISVALFCILSLVKHKLEWKPFFFIAENGLDYSQMGKKKDLQIIVGGALLAEQFWLSEFCISV